MVEIRDFKARWAGSQKLRKLGLGRGSARFYRKNIRLECSISRSGHLIHGLGCAAANAAGHDN
jgi:hypothetical protein